jgi:hypothetical protein
MGLLDKCREERTGMRVPLRINRTAFDMQTEKTGKIRDYTADSNEEYAITLKIQQNFWANKAQLHGGAWKYAVEALAYTLYEDVYRELPHLKACICSGDEAGAMEAVSRIEQAMKP